MWERNQRMHFHFLIDKVVTLLTSWNIIPLSQQHKLVLINSVIIAMISNILSGLEIPAGIANKIDSMIASFFWEKQGARRMHWVPRDIIHLPKGMGGLGIRKVSAFNSAFFMKQAW